jgi:hypothetical protein
MLLSVDELLKATKLWKKIFLLTQRTNLYLSSHKIRVQNRRLTEYHGLCEKELMQK